MRKHPAVGMRAVDLGELYTYLKLFGRVYTDCETERQIIEHGIEEIFSKEYQGCRHCSASHEESHKGGKEKKKWDGGLGANQNLIRTGKKHTGDIC